MFQIDAPCCFILLPCEFQELPSMLALRFGFSFLGRPETGRTRRGEPVQKNNAKLCTHSGVSVSEGPDVEQTRCYEHAYCITSISTDEPIARPHNTPLFKATMHMQFLSPRSYELAFIWLCNRMLSVRTFSSMLPCAELGLGNCGACNEQARSAQPQK